MNCFCRFLVAFSMLSGCCLSAAAAGRTESGNRHTLRLGWGDMLFETAAYYPSARHVFDNPSAIPGSYRVKENFSNWYTGHIFAEYQYRLNGILSVGGQIDFEGLGWKSGWFDKNHTMVESEPDVHFYNIVVMPTVRVTYFTGDLVSVYSGIGAGALLSLARTLEAAPALYINLAGIQVGSGHWSGALDLGMLNSLNGLKQVYMLGSRIISVSLNYSW